MAGLAYWGVHSAFESNRALLSEKTWEIKADSGLLKNKKNANSGLEKTQSPIRIFFKRYLLGSRIRLSAFWL